MQYKGVKGRKGNGKKKETRKKWSSFKSGKKTNNDQQFCKKEKYAELKEEKKCYE